MADDYNYIATVLAFLLIIIVVISGIRLIQFRKLRNIIKGISTGEKNQSDLPLLLSNEVGDMSRSFNSLLNKLEERDTQLRKSKEQLELAIRGTSDGVWDWDLETNELYLSSRWKEMLGYRNDEIDNELEVFNKLLHPDDTKKTWQLANAYLDGKIEKFEIEFRLLHKDGHYVDMLSRAYVVRDESGKPLRLVGTNTDITNRNKEIERRIRYEQEQKKTLVREVHHRIKNNLQGVASLLRQHSERCLTNKEVLLNAISQVHAVAMVHGIQGKRKNSAVYLFDLISEITRLTEDLSGVNIHFHGENKYCTGRLKETEAVPMALIINELIMNACKYSHENYPAEINYLCNWCTDNSISLLISNHTQDFPEDFSLENKVGLGTGLGLVMSLLPPKGVSLDINENYGVVSTSLVIKDPVISMESTFSIETVIKQTERH